MKTNIMVSLPVELVVEARGEGMAGTFSKLLEEAIRLKLNKGLTEEDIIIEKNEQLTELKVEVNQKAQLYPDRFKKCVRYAKYCHLPSGTIDEKIVFWNRVLEDMKKEIPPEPPKEKERIE